MSAEFIAIHPKNPQQRLIDQVADCLRKGGVIIYPTDTVYGLGCDFNNKKAIENLCRIKGIKPEKARLSCICEDLKIIGEYAVHVSTPAYKLMRRALPGPYTFILQASKKIPKHFLSGQKTVGIRVPDNQIPIEIVKALGNPLVSTSLKTDDGFENYPTDAEKIFELYHKMVDIVIDGGPGQIMPSTIIDCSDENEIRLVREGLGSLDVIQ